jgi:hypothetical protein
MKNLNTIFLLICIVFCSAKANAQIQLTSDDVCFNGSFQMALDQTGGFDPGTPGENKIWDFSKLKSQSTFKFKIAPYNGKGNGNESTQVKIDGKDTYNFYQKTGTEMFEVIELNEFNTVYYKKLKTYHFPMAYNSVQNDSFTLVSNFAGAALGMFSYDSIRLTYTMTYLSKADAWGTLKLPTSDFNTLRIRSEMRMLLKVEGKKDTLSLYEVLPDYADADTVTEYNWYGKGKGNHLAIYRVEEDQMQYMVSGVLSTNEVVTNKDIVLSNPLIDETIVGNNGNDDYLLSVYDIHGKLVYTLKMHGHSQNIMNTGEWSAGLYNMQMLNLETQELVCRKLLK